MEEKEETASVLHQLQNQKEALGMLSRNVIIGLVVVALLGVGTGYLLAARGGKVASLGSALNSTTTGGSVTKGTIEGSDDQKTFKDTAEGILREGGSAGGEGQFHLERPGGESQTAFITSSNVHFSK